MFQVADTELRMDLEAACEQLTAKQLQALALYLAGYTQAEIGGILHIGQRAVAYRLRAVVISFRSDLLKLPSHGYYSTEG